MFITSALEQFLLLSDIIYNNILLTILKQFINFLVILPFQIIKNTFSLDKLFTDFFFFNELIVRFHIAPLINSFTNIFDNIVFNLINIQYYKLNIFLVFVFHH